MKKHYLISSVDSSLKPILIFQELAKQTSSNPVHRIFGYAEASYRQRGCGMQNTGYEGKGELLNNAFQ